MRTLERRSASESLCARRSNVKRFQMPRLAYGAVSAAILLAMVAGISKNGDAQQAAMASAQSPSTSAKKTAPFFILASLTKGVDTKKWKTGDEVVAKVAGGKLPDGTAIPKGAKVVGHVTQATAQPGDSALAIVFDKIEMPKGGDTAIKASVQAVGAPIESDSAGGVDYGSSLNRTMEHAQSGESVSAATQILTEQSVGVYGIKDLQLAPDGTLKSGGKSVKVADRSQLLLRAQLSGN